MPTCFFATIIITFIGIFSQKPSYITLSDGKEIRCTLKKVDRKKGLIKSLTILDESDKKQKLKPTDIKFMYLPPNALDRLNKMSDFLSNVQKWNNEKLNQDFLNQGYIYFDQATVKLNKRKTLSLLMQLLNPTFSKVVKVYHDPYAKKTASVGIAGITLAGGNAKSYYIQLSGDSIAYKIEKKKYKKQFATLWGKCDSLKQVTDIKWKNLTNNIISYSNCVQ